MVCTKNVPVLKSKMLRIEENTVSYLEKQTNNKQKQTFDWPRVGHQAESINCILQSATHVHSSRVSKQRMLALRKGSLRQSQFDENYQYPVYSTDQ